MSETEKKGCRICSSPAEIFFQDSRTFYKCRACDLIFTLDEADPGLAETHYKKQWQTTEPGFWRAQVDVLLNLIFHYRFPQRILDFGSGSGEMTRELRSRGFDVTPLEPMLHGFLSDQTYPDKFDAVIAVEVIEHLPDVWRELREIENVLMPDGIMVFSTLMTNPFVDRLDSRAQFQNWWYKDDPTHLNFFCNKTLQKLADLGPFDIDVFEDKLFVLKKRARENQF